MPKFPKMLYVREEGRGNEKWLLAYNRLEDHAIVGKTLEIGVYKLVERIKAQGRGVVVK